MVRARRYATGTLLLSYAVNIVAAIAIIIIGDCSARDLNTVNRLMRARVILMRRGRLSFCAGALWGYQHYADCGSGSRGVQTASVIAVLGAASL